MTRFIIVRFGRVTVRRRANCTRNGYTRIAGSLQPSRRVVTLETIFPIKWFPAVAVFFEILFAAHLGRLPVVTTAVCTGNVVRNNWLAPPWSEQAGIAAPSPLLVGRGLKVPARSTATFPTTHQPNDPSVRFPNMPSVKNTTRASPERYESTTDSCTECCQIPVTKWREYTTMTSGLRLPERLRPRSRNRSIPAQRVAMTVIDPATQHPIGKAGQGSVRSTSAVGSSSG